MRYEPATRYLWDLGLTHAMNSLSCESIKDEIWTQIKDKCLARWLFDEFLPGLAPKAVGSSDEDQKLGMMWQLDCLMRHYACADCTMGTVLAFGHFGGNAARKLFLRIMRDQMRGNSSERP